MYFLCRIVSFKKKQRCLPILYFRVKLIRFCTLLDLQPKELRLLLWPEPGPHLFFLSNPDPTRFRKVVQIRRIPIRHTWRTAACGSPGRGGGHWAGSTACPAHPSAASRIPAHTQYRAVRNTNKYKEDFKESEKNISTHISIYWTNLKNEKI